jgi:hypothetical protein
MREIRLSGSVRGVRRNPYPYRDTLIPTPEAACFAGASIARRPSALLAMTPLPSFQAAS